MKAITSTRIKTVVWLLAFIALTFVTLCKMYWPALPFMFVAFHFYDKNAEALRSLKKSSEDVAA